MFFPSMSISAIHHIRASSFNVQIQILEFFPMFAIRRFVSKLIIMNKSSSKILLIMGIDTMKSIMGMIKRTHDSLVFKHEKTSSFFFEMK